MRRLAPSLILALSVLPAAAQSPAPSPAPKPAPQPCGAPEHRQFDFWLGEWEVHTPDGKLVGTSHVDLELGGCVLHENWTSARGAYAGQSFNIYRPAQKQWHQSWVDTGGQLLLLDGELRDGRMVLAGETRGTDGKVVRQRITWEARPDGSVRQLWEQSADGAAWTTAFDGLYTKKPAPRP
jgi:hypothetical protein